MNDENELQAIRERHNNVEPPEGFSVSLRDGQQAHADRATLLRLLDAERACYKSTSAAANNVIDGLTAELAKERARRVEVEGAIESLESLLPGPMAWLDRWAVHVGSCAGSHLCTCGLSLARYELFSGIEALPATITKDTP